ncbi:opossum [Anaeramoeba flamelloides]|uniref:Opossum n=1 Tax=Anaeramoeba flamelloides TaxID=1746091 RepID=A0AAV7YUM5_9EUKA|nr:opossum isoform a [Anaeramoeba flamelloides]KAJ6240306.1 opossum [Anaeramoeba flamelloides]
MNLQQLFFVFLLCLIFTIKVNAISLTIEPHKSVCFYENMKKRTRVHTDFQVLKGGKLDISFSTHDPRGRQIYSVNQKTTGNHNFVSKIEGEYAFCFDNTFSTVSAKEVTFNFKAHGRGTFARFSTAKDDSQTGASTHKEIGKLTGTLENLSENIEEVRELQMYLKAREIAHRNTTESTNSRILWWSLFATFLIVAASLAQITYLRNIFAKTRRV